MGTKGQYQRSLLAARMKPQDIPCLYFQWRPLAPPRPRPTLPLPAPGPVEAGVARVHCGWARGGRGAAPAQIKAVQAQQRWLALASHRDALPLCPTLAHERRQGASPLQPRCSRCRRLTHLPSALLV